MPEREAYIAGFVDRLPDGAAMDVKSLAKAVPLYGQQAVRTALNALSRAGHLHRVRGLAATSEGGTRWVFRTFWSRTVRDDAWWARFLDGEEREISARLGEVPALDHQSTNHVNSTPDQPTFSSDPLPDTAYRALARLGTVEPRLALSAADCDALTDLVLPWLERGASAVSVIKTLTADLPDTVHAPRGFVARRLRDKLPPASAPAPEQDLPASPLPRPRRLMPECTDCGVPGRPAAFVGGLCRGCRRDAVHTAPVAPPQPRPPVPRHTAVALARDAVAARDRRQPAKT
ncbi:MAG: hypothetical protein JF597_38640 [Streptomyces sp.]|uniref:hypothetical protein n=1 Tax=Streptomyces sp. TaxID=1931 RepID=UPI0025E187B0|nr:hypothetical protein [Streptomyces sp.]MBW8799277.1 hypothetical protein [Streptomyces sp.]